MSNSPVSTFILQMGRAALAAVTVILCSRWMGADGRGELGLLLFWVNLVMVASDYVGGSSLANMMQQHRLSSLLPVSLMWALFCALGGTLIFYISGGPDSMTLGLLLLSVPLVLTAVQNNMYQGLALVRTRNLLQLLAEFLKLLFLLFAFYRLNQAEILGFGDVVMSFFWASALVLVISTWMLRKPLAEGFKGGQRPPADLFISGFWSQNGHMVQFLSYRLSLWLLASLLGSAAPAGVYANALLLADTVWIFANSFGTVAHMRILQSRNDVFRADITLRYATMAVAGTAMACTLMALVPAGWFSAVFGPDFTELKDTAMWLIPAILAVSAASLFSHWLHAVNRFRELFLANLAGLVVQVTLALLLIPSMGLRGACLAADAGFLAVLLVVFAVFRKAHPGARLHGAFRFRAMFRVMRNFVRS